MLFKDSRLAQERPRVSEEHRCNTFSGMFFPAPLSGAESSVFPPRSARPATPHEAEYLNAPLDLLPRPPP